MPDAEAGVIDVTDAPEDFAAYEVWRESGGGSNSGPKELVDVTPPAGDEEPASEPLQETEEGQTAAESETTEEEEEQEETAEDQEPQEPKPGKPGKGTEKRFRKLTGEIAALKARLEELNTPDDEQEETPEAASGPEPAAPAVKTPRPKLSDFEDNNDGTAWEQYEAARDAHQAAELKAAIEDLKAEAAAEKAQLAQQHAKNIADVAWADAASRYDDYNAVVMNDEVRISPAMEAVMRMDPKSGTDIAYYLGKHPEESLRIAQATIHNSEREWPSSLAKAGVELGKLTAKAGAPAPKTPPAAAAPKTPAATAATPAPKPTTKTITKASPPPTQIRAKAVAPKTDVLNDDDARDFNKWEAQRNKELALKGKR